ncbi:uncharacterized protein TrAtP1_011743 [Trichoderma atroviride]|uniref:uncharacterized protein n=1 Tax=Hypocrea atroviridis TaxID=63577 RepID=UPI00331EFB8D|nr:hypothetical protein TrAtP1_011743 [Trichoderma atroviride]
MDVRTEKPGKHNDPGMAQSMSAETLVEDDNKVTDTEYMTKYGMTFWEHQGYIQEVAGHLFEAVRTSWWCADQETRARVTEILPRLLKGFASRLRYDTDYLIHQDIITFIDEHSGDIATEFLNIGSMQGKGDVDKPWRFVFNTRASGWLRTQLRREFCLASTGPNIIQEIQDTIMSAFPPAPEYSEDSSRQYYAVTFELECDLLFFFETQSPEQPGEGIGTAFTLTGSELDVQGATCSNYMRQTWPMTGDTIIELVTGALRVQQGCAFMSMF